MSEGSERLSGSAPSGAAKGLRSRDCTRPQTPPARPVARRPSSSSSTRPASSMTRRSCVQAMMETPRSRQTSRMSVKTVVAVAESSSPVGSSASSRAGSVTRARAMATRCCSPPESSEGRWRARRSRPTRASASRARAARPRRSPAMRRGSSTFSCAESRGSRPKDWKTKPSLRRRRRTSAPSSMASTRSPSMLTSPSVGRSSPATRLSRVVLPEPERPMRARNSPGASDRLTSRTAHTSSAPRRKRRETPRSSTAAPLTGARPGGRGARSRAAPRGDPRRGRGGRARRC